MNAPGRMPATTERAPSPALPAFGALLAAIAVALSAYASHGLEGAAQRSLMMAAAVAFGHGVALAALSPVHHAKLACVALLGLALGCLLFTGGIAAGVFLGIGGQVAPFGGTLLILSWLLLALASLRGR